MHDTQRKPTRSAWDPSGAQATRPSGPARSAATLVAFACWRRLRKSLRKLP